MEVKNGANPPTLNSQLPTPDSQRPDPQTGGSPSDPTKGSSLAGGSDSPDSGGGGNSLDGDPEPELPPVREWTDESGTVYLIVDNQVIIAFKNPPVPPPEGTPDPIGDPNWLQDPTIQQFINQTGIVVLTDWPSLKALYAGLPQGTTVEQAVLEYPANYPDLVEAVSPDALVPSNDVTPADEYWFDDEPGYPYVFGRG